MKISKNWIKNKSCSNKVEYVNKNTGCVVTHFANGRIVASRNVPLEEIEENPAMFIEKGCLQACKALWDLNIFTVQSDGYKKTSSYIEIGTLSQENMELFKSLSKAQPQVYEITESGQIVIHGKGEIKEDLVSCFKMQDVYEGVFTLKDIIQKYYTGELDYIVKENGTLELAIPEEITKEKRDEIIQKAVEDGFIYISKENKFYQSEFYFDKHLKYLEWLSINDGFKV